MISIIRKREIFIRTPKDWKKFQLNNKTIGLNILFLLDNSEEVIHAFISKYNSMRENQVTLSMITDNEN